MSKIVSRGLLLVTLCLLSSMVLSGVTALVSLPNTILNLLGILLAGGWIAVIAVGVERWRKTR